MDEGKTLRAPALDPATVEPRIGSDYPIRFRALVASRERRRLGDALGLKSFGVNLMRLPPACASSQRHWHSRQDEFVFVVAGEVVLITDGGEQRLTAGMAAGFSAGYLGGGATGYQKVALEANLNLTEMCQAAIDIGAVSSLPLILDGACGYGDPMHMHRTIGMSEAAGFAAI